MGNDKRFSGGPATAFPLPQPPPQAAQACLCRLGRGHGVGFALTPAEAGAYYTTAKALSRYSCYSLRKTGFFGPGLSYIGFAELNNKLPHRPLGWANATERLIALCGSPHR